MNDTTDAVTAVEVSGQARLAFLPRYFGRDMMDFEAAVYAAMRAISDDYQGGLWQFYELDNGGCYIAPVMAEPVDVAVAGNYYSGSMSADAAGVVASLFAIGRLPGRWPGCDAGELYHKLLAFARDHAEADAILAAID